MSSSGSDDSSVIGTPATNGARTTLFGQTTSLTAPFTGQMLHDVNPSCLMAYSCRRTWWVVPVPMPVTGTRTPVLVAGWVACAAVATLSGVAGAYMASSNDVVVGCWRPTAYIVVTFTAENEVEM